MGKNITYSNGRTPRICIVGAGFSGLCAAIQLKKQLNLTSFTIFESNNDVGGTWLTNTYPGCACDIPSHLYSYSFELNPGWTENYSSQPEIWRYIKSVAEKYDLYSHIKFKTLVKSLTWNELIKKWAVVVSDENSNLEEAELFDMIINGPGILRIPNVPEEFKSFKGPMIHSADWDPTIKLDNKVVGIIGSGASAVQIIPRIAEKVKELHVYQRKPAYVIPKTEIQFSGFWKTIFFYFPFITRLFRISLYIVTELIFPAIKKKSWLGTIGTKYALRFLKKQIPGNEDLQKKLTPKYTIFCKRITPSNDYYPALSLPKVYVHSENIVQVLDHAIETKDKNLQILDILILATGYRVHDYFAPMEIYGRKSENILSTWKTKSPLAYFGIVSNSTPNLFILLGPYTSLGHSSILFMIECQVNFTISIIREMMRRDAGLVVVKKSAQDDFMNWIENEFKNTVWGYSKCSSWYANEVGVITTLWPQSCTSYWIKTRKPNLSHFEFN